MRPVLQVKNFRLFLSAQASSLLARSIQQIALMWLVYRVTHSVVLIGLVSFFREFPAVVISPFVGVWGDRENPVRIAILNQLFLALQAFALAAVVFSQTTNLPLILTLVCLFGLLNAVDMPIRQILMPRLLGQSDDVASAVGLNAMVYDGVRIIGPVIGGLVVAKFHEGISFAGCGVGQFLALALLLGIHLRARQGTAQHESIGKTLMQGIRYFLGYWPIRSLILLSALVSFAGASYMVLMPVIAHDVLGGGARTFGYLSGSVGAGAIIGGLFFTTCGDNLDQPLVIASGAGLFGLGLLGLALSSAAMVAMESMILAGFGIMIMMAGCNTALIRLCDREKQGRTLGLFTLSYAATSPLGGLFAGYIAAWSSARSTLIMSAILCFAAGVVFFAYARRLRVVLDERARSPQPDRLIY